MIIINIILTILLIYLPRFVICKKKSNIFEKITISIATNTILGIIISVIYKLNYTTIATYIGILIIPTIIKIKKTKIKIPKINKTTALTILSIIIISVPTLLIHINYTEPINKLYPTPHIIEDTQYLLPFHGDEWTHIAQIKYIQETGKISLSNPYFNTNKTRKKITGLLQTGFHITIAEFSILNKANILEIWWILPFLLNVIFGITILNITKTITKKRKKIITITILGTLLYSIQINTINLIANWFLTPINLGIIFLSITIYFIIRNKLKESIITLITLTTIYAPLAIILGLAVLITQKKILKKTYKIIIAGITLITLTKIFSSETINKILKYFIYSPTEYINTDIKYNIFLIIGINIIPLIIGIKEIIKNKKLTILPTIATIAILNIILFQITNYTVIIRYQRSIYLFNSICAIIIAIGFSKIIDNIKKNKILNIILASILVLNIIMLTINYQKIKTEDILYEIINEQEYEFLKEVKNIIGEKNTILTGTIPAMTIYPAINNYVLTIAGGNLDHGDKTIPQQFIELNCTNKLKFTQKRNIDYIWTTFKLNCETFKTTYQKDEYYIYEPIK